ncbi:MAG: type II toxin-antitoxin system RelE/ParE family toxin [Alphaproteobacteria bacterium]|nr:type II toxin-antitoxin system RelE/ParE family toxin [Alphaproteobacteria bacterium]
MSGKPVVLRERARCDIEEAIEHYLAEAGAAVALDLVDAPEIGERPRTGSLRYAHELDIPGLRFRVAGKFPYLVFYVEKEAEVDVWRVLHGVRDVAAWMRESGNGRSG